MIPTLDNNQVICFFFQYLQDHWANSLPCERGKQLTLRAVYQVFLQINGYCCQSPRIWTFYNWKMCCKQIFCFFFFPELESLLWLLPQYQKYHCVKIYRVKIHAILFSRDSNDAVALLLFETCLWALGQRCLAYLCFMI